MPAPILATKLFVPSPPPQVVSRPRLTERLDENLGPSAGSSQNVGFAKKLTLVSAPAGFGKTTLITEWCDTHKQRVAWLSLDEADSEPTRFLTYLIAALQTVAPELGRGVANALEATPPPPGEAIVTALLNQVTAATPNLILVLDDYHQIDSQAVDDSLTFLLDHLPPQIHLVITTREDPQLPLPRLRARGQLTELRAADLRFTPAEAAEFLNAVMGLNLSSQEITQLENRTEGWIAGLQLAAISMRGQEDISAFIRAFAGDHRYIVDYLVAEVLQRQPEPVRHFLLQTSILERLTGSLCDAVTAQEGGSARLLALERGNFFVVPLDDKRHWYRYHHLFAQVLYAHLRAEQPEQISILHRRASVWYEQNGFVEEAVHSAFAAADLERAADLIELAWSAVRKSRDDAMRLGWLKALPDELVHDRPVLSVAYAHLLLASGVREGVEERLQDAERWLNRPASAPARADSSTAENHFESGHGMVVVNEEAFRGLPGSIALARAGLALAAGDVPGSMTYARQALRVAPEQDDMTRGGAAGFLGLADWTTGNLEAAYQVYAQGMASLQRAGNIADAVNGALTLAGIRIAQGRLRKAMHIYEQGLQLAAEHATSGVPIRGTADIHIGLSELAYEHNQMQLATQHLATSQALGELAGFPQNRYRWRIAMARIRRMQGDLEGALELLDEAERMYMSDFSPNVRPIAALKTRIWISQGKLDQALNWARERELSPRNELSYDREFEHITLARLLLAQYQSAPSDKLIRETKEFLERLLQAADVGGRGGHVIEILLLQSLLRQFGNESFGALAPLERALTLAEPEHYIRIFLDEGSPMAQLLAQAAVREILPHYTGKLLAEFKKEQPETKIELPFSTIPASQHLPEPLTEREIEILRLFKTELSGPEIANELVIALSTLRTHTKNIYSKLNVNSRQAAVHRAQALHLI